MADKRQGVESPRDVVIEAPARLHLGFMDLNGGLGRQFGSLGLTLQGLHTRIRARRARSPSAAGEDAFRAEAYLRALSSQLNKPLPVQLTVEQAIPEHMGLGSGTQLALAVGSAANALLDLKLAPRQMAALLDRGARSGIGLGAFEQGGFLIDGGRSAEDEPPRITVRLRFPQDWRLLLTFDQSITGMHGSGERQAFRDLPVFPAESAGRLCRLVMMRILPAVIDAAWAEFGSGISELQRVVGDHYASAQGGRYSSRRVGDVLRWVEAQGIAGVGQSSWGPTGFVVCRNESQAVALLHDLKRSFGREDNLRFEIFSARNDGAIIRQDLQNESRVEGIGSVS